MNPLRLYYGCFVLPNYQYVYKTFKDIRRGLPYKKKKGHHRVVYHNYCFIKCLTFKSPPLPWTFSHYIHITTLSTTLLVRTRLHFSLKSLESFRGGNPYFSFWSLSYKVFPTFLFLHKFFCQRTFSTLQLLTLQPLNIIYGGFSV